MPPTRSGALEIKSSKIDFYEDEIPIIVSFFRVLTELSWHPQTYDFTEMNSNSGSPVPARCAFAGTPLRRPMANWPNRSIGRVARFVTTGNC